MRKISLYLMLLTLGLVLSSCYPDPTIYTEDLDLVYTNYDDQFNFKAYKTYAMPDSIVEVVREISSPEDLEFLSEPYNSQILKAIADNMAAYGWQRVEDPEQADLVLLPAAWTNTTVVYWYDYWCWYYYYGCGWGYYPPYYTTSYTTGTLVMGLIKGGGDQYGPQKAWGGAINGVLTGTLKIDRVTKGVNQAFTQSPYLNIN
jgi:hypothetical protein